MSRQSRVVTLVRPPHRSAPAVLNELAPHERLEGGPATQRDVHEFAAVNSEPLSARLSIADVAGGPGHE